MFMPQRHNVRLSLVQKRAHLPATDMFGHWSECGVMTDEGWPSQGLCEGAQPSDPRAIWGTLANHAFQIIGRILLAQIFSEGHGLI